MAAKGEVEEMPSRTNSWSRDLLRTFGGETPAEAAGGGDAGDVELSLGLSLGGRFGAEPKDKRLGLGLGLVRSSSIASFSMFPIEQRAEAGHLMRTCSLPAETEEERKRRKEMQSLKRMEAKRKRSEKRAAAAAKEAKERKDETLVEELGGVKLNGGVVVGPAAPPRWAAGNGRGPASGQPGSQASIGSQGSSSSSLSDFENKGIQGNDFSGPGNPAEVGSPSAKSSLSDQTNQKAPTNPPMSPPPRPATTSRDEDEPSGKRICNTIARPNGTKETTERNMAEEMPCVSTRFDGPNGRRVEGFLYKYKKGEDVRIVCVCHGSFLSPAEFVKHAGGGDVTNPLKHIVVSQTSAAFF